MAIHHNFFTALFCASILAVCCTRENAAVEEPARVAVSFRLASYSKAEPFSDAALTSVDLLVFRAGGGLDTYGRADGGSAVTLEVVKGQPLNWYAVVNAPEGALCDVATEEEFLSRRALLADCSADSFIMCGSGSGSFDSPASRVVGVDRCVCRVDLKKLEIAFNPGSVMRLDRICLINAVGSIPYSMIPSASLWYNTMGPDENLQPPVSYLLTDVRNIEFEDFPSSRELESSCFACPNPVDNGVDCSAVPWWTPRNTRLVVETTIGGVKNYYPLTLPAMKPNYRYTVDKLVLLGYGSASPDIPVKRESLSWTITVNPWGSETIEKTMN